MNTKLAVLIFNIIIGLVIGNGSFHPHQAQSYKKYNRVNGKKPFNKIVGEGFQIGYKIGDKTITAFAKGKKVSHLRSGKVKLDERTVVVIAVTDDRALEITTYFTLDEQRQKLIVDRRIRNISSGTVDIQMMGQYVDAKLFGVKGHHAKLQAALKRIRGGQLVSTAPILKSIPEYLRANWREACQCVPPPPPCPTIWCPPGEDYIQARLVSLPGDKMMLLWEPKEPTTLVPRNALADVTSLTSEVRSIMEVDYGRELPNL